MIAARTVDELITALEHVKANGGATWTAHHGPYSYATIVIYNKNGREIYDISNKDWEYL